MSTSPMTAQDDHDQTHTQGDRAMEITSEITSTEAFPAHLIGTTVLIRTRISGVSVGTLRSVSTTVAGWAVVLDDGLRVWSWTGALACSTLAIAGPTTAKTERHPDGIIIADEGMEIIPSSAALWASHR